MGRYYYDEHEPTSSYYREPEKERCCSRLCSWVCNILCLAQVAAALYVAWLLLGRPDLRKFNPDDFTHVLGNLTDKDWDMGFNEDPYVGDNSTQIWKGSKGKGLSLQLQNALDDTWQTEFEAAVGDWKESNTLELTVVNVDVDYSCTPVDGVMVICNGNFGHTGWLGINLILIEYQSKDDKVGVIASSVAKMNEYYLRNATYEQRQYTMCHEIGHGFGLPHTDENFYNSDMGNCLDYTHSPANNMHPGDVNFEKLESLYLSNDASTNGEENDGRRTSTQQQRKREGYVEEEGLYEKEDNKGRYVRRVVQRHYIYRS